MEQNNAQSQRDLSGVCDLSAGFFLHKLKTGLPRFREPREWEYLRLNQREHNGSDSNQPRLDRSEGVTEHFHYKSDLGEDSDAKKLEQGEPNHGAENQGH